MGFVGFYDWRRQREDVLRTFYEQFIDAKDRKVFGEFYTPDWLAEMVVETVLDDDWCRYAADQALQHCMFEILQCCNAASMISCNHADCCNDQSERRVWEDDPSRAFRRGRSGIRSQGRAY